MDNMSPTDPGVFKRWLREANERFGQLLESGRFVAKDPDWVPVRLVALATGYVREAKGKGSRRHLEIRVELLDDDVHARAKAAYGNVVEWLSVQQIAAISELSPQTVTGQYEDLAASLFKEDPNCAVIGGRVMVSSKVLSPRGKERLAEAVKEGRIKLSIPRRQDE